MSRRRVLIASLAAALLSMACSASERSPAAPRPEPASGPARAASSRPSAGGQLAAGGAAEPEDGCEPIWWQEIARAMSGDPRRCWGR
jgi:hypothetical protein